jgi:hypothetical protein
MRYPEAIACGRKTVELRPGFPDGYCWLAAAAALTGDISEATDALAEHRRLVPDYTLVRARENQPLVGDVGERLLEGLRRAGVPER